MITDEKIQSELEKCKNSPYYFATNYMTCNGKPFTTHLTEEEFNNVFHYYFNKRRNKLPESSYHLCKYNLKRKMIGVICPPECNGTECKLENKFLYE